MADIDLNQLALERRPRQPRAQQSGRHVATRYALPAILVLGFLGLITWATWDVMFPGTPVTVIPVMAVDAKLQVEGTPLFQAAGWIEPRPTPVRVAALAPGVVEQLLVVEDQTVNRGDPIAELVKDDARLVYQAALADQQLRAAELEKSQALLAAAQTRLDQPVHLEAQLAEAEAKLAGSKTMLQNLPFQIRRADADLAFAQQEYRRNLRAGDAVAPLDVDEAKSRMDAAQAQAEEFREREAFLKNEIEALTARRDALRKQLELLADEIRDRDEALASVGAAKARLEQSRVAVAEAELQLSRMTIRAPIDGRIYRLVGHPGARLGGERNQMEEFDGSTVVTMYRPDSLQVRVDVRFEDIPKVQLGQTVSIGNAAVADSLEGRVLYISSEADIQKNTLQVKVAIPNPPEVFKPEMLVDTTFLSSKSDESAPSINESVTSRIYVPKHLVQSEGGQDFVWVADQSARVARKMAVQTGAAGPDNLVEISSGLTIASRLIFRADQPLQDGQRIRITGEAMVNQISISQ